MKIIDILNKMADGTLEDGFKFKYEGSIFNYDKRTKTFTSKDGYEDEKDLDDYIYILGHLTDEVEVIEDVKEIQEVDTSTKINLKNMEIRDLEILVHNCEDKINELVQAVNELRKEKKK